MLMKSRFETIIHYHLGQQLTFEALVSSTRKKNDPTDERLKNDSFNKLFRRYNQLVRNKYWLTEPTPDQLATPAQPLLCNQYTFPIWIVDDNPDIPILMKMVFNRINPTVTATFLRDGNELIDTLKKATVLPRVILLDLFMEPMNGFDILSKIRTHAIYKHLPVVMYTGSINENDRQKAMALGADEFLSKPYTFNQTITAINHLVERWS
jgi:CheY-like chemotaxis protein